MCGLIHFNVSRMEINFLADFGVISRIPMFVFVLERISFAYLKVPSIDQLASTHLAVFFFPVFGWLSAYQCIFRVYIV